MSVQDLEQFIKEQVKNLYNQPNKIKEPRFLGDTGEENE